MSSTRSPTTAEVIRNAINSSLVSVHVSIPAVVTKWDPGKQRADCKPLVKQPYFDEEGEPQVESVPIVPGVPVAFQGGGEFRSTYPIVENETTGLLVFADRSLDKWLSGGGEEVDPALDNAHDLADAVFYPGLKPFGAPWAKCPTDSATFGHDSGDGIIVCKQAEVRIGDGDHKLLFGDDFKDGLNQFLTDLNTFTQAIIPLTGVPAAAKVTFATALALFQGLLPSYLSNVGKTK